MTVDDQTTSSRSEARVHFAERLRMLRIPRGFRTARSFAKALGIDENRYTRYERAEVEPDLGLIRRICALLAVTPNDLLGVPVSAGNSASKMNIGDEIRNNAARNHPNGGNLAINSASHSNGARYSNLSLSMTAWAISGLIANARHLQNGGNGHSNGASDAFHREASEIFESIMRSPKSTMQELSNEAALIAAGPDAIREFVALSEHFSSIAPS